MCPEERIDALDTSFNDIAIAWDHTAPAARALGDALPLLRRASRLRILTATTKRAKRSSHPAPR